MRMVVKYQLQVRHPVLIVIPHGNNNWYHANAFLSGTINQIYSGDTNSSGLIDASDCSGTWNNQNQVGYLIFDCNLNGTVDASDRAFT